MAKITTHPNGIIVKSNNRRIEIIDNEDSTLINFIGLTKNIGKKSLRATISKNGKVKCTPILISDDGVKDHYSGLHIYLKK